MTETAHERAEAALTAYGLTFPETTAGLGLPPTRALYFRKHTFGIFGEKGQGRDALTVIAKLPISFEMVQGLPFVRESRGWYRQHNWAIAHFGPNDDPMDELDTLKAWLRQSYSAIAPKTYARA